MQILDGLKKIGDPEGSAAFFVANSGMKGLIGADQAAVQVTRWATDARTTSVIDPVNQFAADTIGEKFFMPLAFGTIAVAGLLVMRRGNDGDIDHSARDAGWTVFVITVATVAVLWPTVVAPKFDAAIRDTVEYGNTTISTWSTNGSSGTLADSLAAALHRGNAYETWKRGMFGGNTVCANKYGPDLFKAGAISRKDSGIKPVGWDEEVLEFLVGSEAFKEKVFEQRRDQYEDVVEKIKEDSACGDAYEYIAGRKNGERVLAMVVGWVAFLLNGLFLAVMNLLLLFSSITIRFFIAFLPLIALVSGVRQWKHHLIGPAKYVWAVAQGAVAFGIGTVFLIALYGWLIGSGISFLAVLLLMLVCTVVTAKLLWPFVKAMWPPEAARRAREAKEKWEEQQRWAREKNAQSGQWLREARSMRDRDSHPAEDESWRASWRKSFPAEARMIRALPAAATGPRALTTTAAGGAARGALTGATKALVAGAATGGVGAGVVAASAAKSAAAGATTAVVTSPGAHRLNRTAATAAESRLGRDSTPAEAIIDGSRAAVTRRVVTGRLFHPPEYTGRVGPQRVAPTAAGDGTTHVITTALVPPGHRTDRSAS
ncbi:MAG: hypothetical protein ACRCZP_11630 [Phycicoccus sp.]